MGILTNCSGIYLAGASSSMELFQVVLLNTRPSSRQDFNALLLLARLSSSLAETIEAIAIRKKNMGADILSDQFRIQHAYAFECQACEQRNLKSTDISHFNC